MPRTAILASCLLVGFGMLNGATCLAQDETGQRDVVPFMRIKLAHTKEIVEGLALNDFESIVRSTQKLNLMSLESSWNVYESTEYTELSKTFRESVDRLRKAAVRKSSDGAMLAYFEVTLNCVRCHQYLRDRHPKPDSPRE